MVVMVKVHYSGDNIGISDDEILIVKVLIMMMVIISMVAMMSHGCNGKGGDYDCDNGDDSIPCNDDDLMV